MTDLYFYYDLPDGKMYHSASTSKTSFERIDYIYNKFNLKEILWYDHKFFIPENEIDFILTKYGETWTIPDPNWDHILGPKNAKKHPFSMSKQQSQEYFKQWASL
jgi:hypothetical protein